VRKQLKAHPLCRHCKIKLRDTPAITAVHVEPHHGNWMKFWHGRLGVRAGGRSFFLDAPAR
jgi:hypothetical protein